MLALQIDNEKLEQSLLLQFKTPKKLKSWSKNSTRKFKNEIIKDLMQNRKIDIKLSIIKNLKIFKEIDKIILFGSFINSNNPNDIDIAIFQNSNQKFIPLSLKYRKSLKTIAKIIPIDVIPIKNGIDGEFIKEIQKGEIIYEKRD